ncbi:hypothetical protein BS78_06G064300 [Paspalum vaginatum]|nr:hypothetical protein BS78_06G064300 [Paspalum vaginatum]
MSKRTIARASTEALTLERKVAAGSCHGSGAKNILEEWSGFLLGLAIHCNMFDGIGLASWSSSTRGRDGAAPSSLPPVLDCASASVTGHKDDDGALASHSDSRPLESHASRHSSSCPPGIIRTFWNG